MRHVLALHSPLHQCAEQLKPALSSPAHHSAVNILRHASCHAPLLSLLLRQPPRHTSSIAVDRFVLLVARKLERSSSLHNETCTHMPTAFRGHMMRPSSCRLDLSIRAKTVGPRSKFGERSLEPANLERSADAQMNPNPKTRCCRSFESKCSRLP